MTAPADDSPPTRQQISDSLRTEYPWTRFVSAEEFEALVDKIHAAEHL